MCGITGYWNIGGTRRSGFDDELRQAVSVLNHRGPDDSGIWTNHHGVGLGHTRLSILDLSKHGHQPMVTPDGRYVLVFNGEVYNFRKIRKELKNKGHHFVSEGDSEVVLAAFSEWGKECVYRFIGMFAFAVWDEQDRVLYLCRDRAGVKPLYYGWHHNMFCFASELKALTIFKHWQPEINRQALGEFFQYGYIAAPRSIYKNVSKLLPGHWLTLQERSEPSMECYWSVLKALEQGKLQGNEDNLAEQLETLLVDAFRYRMVSDVPVGVFFSGGIDSCIVAAILQKHSGQQIYTFTIGFKENTYDESRWAKKIAGYLGTEHTEFILEREMAEEIIPTLPWIYDEPFGDSSGIPTYLVSKLAREKVKVALSADGGDELFGGYTGYTLNPVRLGMIKKQPRWLRNLVGRAISATPVKEVAKIVAAASVFGGEIPGKLLRKWIKLGHVLPEPNLSTIFQASKAHWMPSEINRLIGSYADPRSSPDIYSGRFEEQMMQWDFNHYLPGDIMTKVDRTTMAVGLEGREPLLDHRLIEFAFRLPFQYRIGRLGQKHLLRKVLYKYVPRSLIDRPKHGFEIPLNRWLRGEKSNTLKTCLAEPSILEGILDMDMVRREICVYRKTGAQENKIWLLFMLHQWMLKWAV